MNTPRLYLNVIPESLVASMLSPEHYGTYMAVGLQAKTRGQAMFFEVNPEMVSKLFPVEAAFERCRKESEIAPKHSVYLSIYRVFELLPLEALGRLYLATDDGRVMGLDAAPYEPEEGRAFHLYQELLPVKPRVVSRLAPPQFARHLTDPGHAIAMPKLLFTELVLHELAKDPAQGQPENLPYPNIEHLRDCLLRLIEEPDKMTKLVIRHLHQELLYRTIRNGFFAGDRSTLLYYPMPSKDALEDTHRDWWRSALTVHID